MNHPDLVLCACIILGLICYIVYLHKTIETLHVELNDIFDRIRVWRKRGSTDPEAYWLLGDIAGIIARRMGYNHATIPIQRPTGEKDSGE